MKTSPLKDATPFAELAEVFTALSERAYVNLVLGDRETILARVASTSYIAALDPPEREDVLRRVRHLLDTDEQTRGREQIEMPYVTHLVWCRASGREGARFNR